MDGRRAYVVDDETSFRQSLALLLESFSWYVETFESASEFIRHIDDLRPGLLFLDLRMPEAGGLDLLESGDRRLVDFAPVVVTGHGDVTTAVRAMKAGAVDYIEKPFSAEVLDRLGNSYVELMAAVELKHQRADATTRVARLSPREREVLARLLGGATNKMMARSMGLSERTVEMHRARMTQKLNVRTTTEALHIGMLGGLSSA